METNTTPELVAALVEARKRFAAIEKDGTNPHLHNRYATLGSVLDAVTVPLLDAGLVVTQTPVPMDGGWALQTTLRHVGGGELSGLVPLSTGEVKALNPMQALGSAISYGRRYGLLSLLCLTAEDDDGATAGNGRIVERPDRRQSAPPPRPSGNGGDFGDRPPKTGRALFAWVKRQEEDTGLKLVDRLNAWGKAQGWPKQMTDWDADMVAQSVQNVRRAVEAAEAEVDADAGRDED